MPLGKKENSPLIVENEIITLFGLSISLNRQARVCSFRYTQILNIQSHKNKLK